MRYLPGQRRPWTKARAQRYALAAAGVVMTLIILAAIVAALTGFLLLAALAVGLSMLNLLYLPRLAARLRISPAWLAVSLLPLFVVIGLTVGGAGGGALAASLWIVAIGLPRVIARDLVRRVRHRLVGSAAGRIYDVTGRTRGPGEPPLPRASDRGPDEFGL